MGRIKNKNTGYVKSLTKNDTSGYLSVRLDMGKNVKKKTYDIHRLVAKMFIGECPDGHIVNHKDLNKHNNRISNLEYITYSENTKHYLANRVKKPKADIMVVKLDDREVREIKGFSKYVIDRSGNVFIKNTKKLKAHDATNGGYDRELLIPDDTTKHETVHKYVHRLVAETYIPNPNNLPFVDHINANKKDNRVENLEWCTSNQNMKHDSVMRGTGKRVRCYNAETGKYIKTYPAIKEAARELNINSTSITGACSEGTYYAGGYLWKLAEDSVDKNVSDIDNETLDQINKKDRYRKNKISEKVIDIIDYAGEIIREFPNYVVNRCGQIFLRYTGKIVQSMKNYLGFVQVMIGDTVNLVSNLVAEAFIENPNNYQYVMHINANIEDNCAENLAWCSEKTLHECKYMRKIFGEISDTNSDNDSSDIELIQPTKKKIIKPISDEEFIEIKPKKKLKKILDDEFIEMEQEQPIKKKQPTKSNLN